MNLDAVNLDALYLVKLIFCKYFCYFDSNHVAASLQLQLYLDANRVPVHELIKPQLLVELAPTLKVEDRQNLIKMVNKSLVNPIADLHENRTGQELR